MKTLLVIIAILFGWNIATEAAEKAAGNTQIVTTQTPNYTILSVKEVPQAVMKAFNASYSITKLTRIEVGVLFGEKLYRFTLVDDEQKEFTVYFTSIGQELNF